MKAKIVHLYEVVAGFILSLLGFTSCDKIIQMREEYGMPHATYKLVGSVKDARTGEGIEGLQVTYRRPYPTGGDEEEHFYEESVLSGKDGSVQVTLKEYDAEASDKLSLRIKDIDGDKNGLYETKELAKKDLDIVFEKDDKSNWHTGTYTIGFQVRLNDYTEIAAEYGVPHATYQIKGTVTDPDGKPIPGIEVLAKLWNQESGPEEEMYLPTGVTDAQGQFSLEEKEWPGATNVRVECKDVDGEANGGLFESASEEATLTRQAEGDGNWDDGTFGATVDIRLKKAE